MIAFLCVAGLLVLLLCTAAAWMIAYEMVGARLDSAWWRGRTSAAANMYEVADSVEPVDQKLAATLRVVGFHLGHGIYVSGEKVKQSIRNHAQGGAHACQN